MTGMIEPRLSHAQINRLMWFLANGWVRDDDDDDYNASWAEFTNRMGEIESSVELHCLAVNLNWDQGESRGPQLVIDHDLCDKGTALTLYWLAEPQSREYHDDEMLSFLDSLADRYIGGRFATAMIAFDPIAFLKSSYKERVDTSLVPEEMRKQTPGADLSELSHLIGLLSLFAWLDRGDLDFHQLMQSLNNPRAIEQLSPTCAFKLRLATSDLRKSSSVNRDASIEAVRDCLRNLAGA